jgi:hypothetical protein
MHSRMAASDEGVAPHLLLIYSRTGAPGPASPVHRLRCRMLLLVLVLSGTCYSSVTFTVYSVSKCHI